MELAPAIMMVDKSPDLQLITGDSGELMVKFHSESGKFDTPIEPTSQFKGKGMGRLMSQHKQSGRRSSHSIFVFYSASSSTDWMRPTLIREV
jgi:hypothetical protein